MKVVCLIGPSGVGKSSVVTELLRRGLVSITESVTDRPRRDDESPLEHIFVTPDEFTKQQADGRFLDTVQPFGLPYRYGLPSVKVASHGTVPLVMLRAPFIGRMRGFYPDLVVYQIEAPLEFVAGQLRRRKGDMGTRLTDYEKEIALGRSVADRVFVNQNITIPELADQVAAALVEDFSNI